MSDPDATGYGDISNATITHNGVTLPLREWAESLNIPYATLRMRYARGKRDAADLLRPSYGPGRVSNIGSVMLTRDGATKTIMEWCEQLQLPYKTVCNRWRRGERDVNTLLFKPGHTKDAQGNWVYHSTPTDLANDRARITRFALINIFDQPIAEQITALASEYEMQPDEVITTIVEDFLKNRKNQ